MAELAVRSGPQVGKKYSLLCGSGDEDSKAASAIAVVGRRGCRKLPRSASSALRSAGENIKHIGNVVSIKLNADEEVSMLALFFRNIYDLLS